MPIIKVIISDLTNIITVHIHSINLVVTITIANKSNTVAIR